MVSLDHDGSQEAIDDIVDSYYEKLAEVFLYYCAFGEPLNTSKLKSSKYMKLLRDCNLVATRGQENVSTN